MLFVYVMEQGKAIAGNESSFCGNRCIGIALLYELCTELVDRYFVRLSDCGSFSLEWDLLQRS